MPAPPADGTKAASVTSAVFSHSDEDESSDENTGDDFVSGAFWELNRKIPIPTARHAVLPGKSGGSSSSEVSVNNLAAGSPSPGGGADSTNTEDQEDLDEGYSDLSTVSGLNLPGSKSKEADKAGQYATVNKPSGSVDNKTYVGNAGKVDAKDNSGQLTAGGSELGSGQNVSSGNSVGVSGATGSEETSVTTAVSQDRQDTREHVENCYAPFPGTTDGGTETPSTQAAEVASGMSEGVIVVKAVHSTSQQKDSAAALVSNDLETDSMYSSAAEASSLPAVPPLPPRQDSLPVWSNETPSESSVNGTSAAASNKTTVSGTSQGENATNPRPIPRRRTVHSSSGVMQSVSNENSADTPPVPPRRGVPLSQGVSVDSAIEPPPLPVRRTQSIRSQQRPLTAPPSNGELAGDDTSDLATAGMESSGLFRQQVQLLHGMGTQGLGCRC